MAEINLAQEIAKHLKVYSTEVEQDLQAAKKEVADKAVTQLKASSGFNDRSGRYRKGWRVKKVGDNYTIHNATDASLTHLLEKGHVLRNGGRSKSFKHIAPVEEMVITDFEDIVRKRLS